MKNRIIILTLTLLVGMMFSSCKKSENDPTLPFSSRDARITNVWQLASLTKTVTTVNSLESTDEKVYTFDGTTMTLNHKNIFGSRTETTYSYSDKLEILDNNAYVQTIVESGNTLETQAYWYWHDSNKDKTGISFDNGVVYSIYRLAKDELILEYAKHIKEIDENGDITTITNEEILTYSAE